MIRELAVGEDDVRWRLRDAYLVLHTIQPTRFPTPLQPHFRWVLESLTAKEERMPGEGRLMATLRTMRKSTGGKIARRILEIADALDELLEGSGD